MTKEELERIKQAYNSGLKVQIWFNGHWEDFDAREHAMYSDPFSENRQYRIIGSAYTDIAEKRISELEKENTELKKRCSILDESLVTSTKNNIERQKIIDELKERPAKAKGLIEKLSESLFLAKGIIRDLIDDTVDFKESKERAIYCYEQEHLDTYKEAVQFLKEVEK